MKRSLMKVCTIVLAASALAGCGGSSSNSDSATSRATVKKSEQSPAGWRTSVTTGSGNFDSVACPATDNCWATTRDARIFKFSAGKWSLFPAPKPTPDVGLLDIACPGTNDCWAVGSSTPSASAQTGKTLIEHFDGRTWNVVPSPNAQGFPESVLTAVACPSRTDCWAAGDGEDNSQNPSTGALLLEHYNGTAWSIAQAPSPQQEPQTGAKGFIQCPSTTQCILLTNFGTSGGQNSVEAGDVFDGRRWSSLSVPNGILLQGASCIKPNDCYAIGGTDFSGTMSIYHFAGTAWTLGSQLPAMASGAPVSWSALSCQASGGCWAAGGMPITANDTSPAVVTRFVHGVWAIPNQPSVVGELEGISCVSASACHAVGEAAVSQDSTESKLLALRLSR